MGPRRLTDAPLHVEPGLVGAPLASPARRFAAFLVDGLLLIVPAVIVPAAAAALALSVSDPRAFHAIRSAGAARTDAARQQFWRDLAPLLVRLESPGMPAVATAAVEEGDLNRAASVLKDYNLTFALELLPETVDQPVPPRTIALRVERLIPKGMRLASLLGVPALYFVAFARSRRGATLGKRLLGLRVVRLDGERLSWLEALERFVGYLHIPGTAFVSLVDLWRDPNRRLPHDRVVHTVVLRAASGPENRRPVAARTCGRAAPRRPDIAGPRQPPSAA